METREEEEGDATAAAGLLDSAADSLALAASSVGERAEERGAERASSAVCVVSDRESVAVCVVSGMEAAGAASSRESGCECVREAEALVVCERGAEERKGGGSKSLSLSRSISEGVEACVCAGVCACACVCASVSVISISAGAEDARGAEAVARGEAGGDAACPADRGREGSRPYGTGYLSGSARTRTLTPRTWLSASGTSGSCSSSVSGSSLCAAVSMVLR